MNNYAKNTKSEKSSSTQIIADITTLINRIKK